MPTYTYRCTNCEYQFDIKQRMAEDPLTDCPACEKENVLRKVLNPVGIVFKGSGFYVTDSRGKNGASAPSASANGKSENGSSDKTESTAKANGSKAETPSPSANGSGKSKTEKTVV